MSKIFELTTDLPETDNHIYGQSGKFRFMYKKASNWKLSTQEKAKKIWKKKPLECPVWLDVQIFYNRDRDTQGGLKLLCDALEGIVYVNDKQITELTAHKEQDKLNPRVIIKVESL
jgi:Holliday junction resolvase RusA-like endonuclease